MPFYGGSYDLAATPESYLIPQGNPYLVITPKQEVVLTAGSDLDRAAISSGNRGLPWPKLLDWLSTRFFRGAWTPNDLQEIHHVNVPGNYGSKTSVANFGFRGREFAGVGNMPGPVWNAKRPTYNNLVPIIWGLRDLDPSAQAQPGELIGAIQVSNVPMAFTTAGNASLGETVL